VGVKPSYGRVSRYGLVAFGSSLDCVSVFGATVDDAARVLAAISGRDLADATCLDRPPMEPPPTRTDLKGLTVGLPREYLPPDLHPGIRAGVERAGARCRELGAAVREVFLPNSALAVPTYYIIAPAEAAANLARYDGVRYGRRREPEGGDVEALYRATRGAGFGAEVRRRILIGTYVLSAGYYEAYYGRAQAARARLAADFAEAFAAGCDLLLTPTTPTPAFRAGEKLHDPVSMYLADVFVCAVSLAGLPALSLPAGRSDGLPVGIQLIAPRFAEPSMLAAARVLERHLDPLAEVQP
jgi:aspartyl-tRNA(Asn)/glutamyl-tRNA(Gln) amidotransferase subunit A